MRELIPLNTALELYQKSECDLHSKAWFNLKYKAIESQQSSIFIDDPKSPDIKKCTHCSLRFEDSQDWLNHMIDEHEDWGLD